ncbi:MAG: tetratricopeptide repeat protein [Anaerolineae bacterium]|nr:tetratricopeptide repeat protein [Anaerolineae bacterium]
MTLFRRILIFLGPGGSRAFFILLASTGLISLVLNTVDPQVEWVRPAQTGLALVFMIGTLVIIFLRLPPDERGRWGGIFAPVLAALAIGIFVAPQFIGVLIGASLGWIVAAGFITRNRMPVDYREAIKHLRKNNYAEAVRSMDQVIKDDPNHAQHYKFRAEVYRVWGKLDRAVRDYQRMTELAPESPIAFNGLAEVYLQRGEYPRALEAGRKAHELAPGDWVALYNLGMIEDRLKLSGEVVTHLSAALKMKINDVRHRALVHLYLVRAYARLGRPDSAQTHVDALKKHTSGLTEWETILKDKQAETLRAVIGTDVDLAMELASGRLTATDLVRQLTHSEKG